MQSKARLHDISFGANGKQRVCFELDTKFEPERFYKTDETGARVVRDMRIEATEWREKRSLDANGLLWACLSKIASALNTDKWEVYLMMLKRYGKFTYVVVPTGAVDQLREMWRETEVVGEIEVNGRKATQVLCYFGSSTYDTKQFSILLNGVKSEMAEMGIQTPDQEEMQRVLDEWEKSHGQSKTADTSCGNEH